MIEKRKKQIFKIFAAFFVAAFLLSTSIKAIPEKKSLDERIFDLKVKTYMKILNYPSLTVCVIKNNTVVWNNAYGYSNVYLRKKATLDTIYVIGSISKCVTATAAMQLYEKNYFDLDDNVSKWLPFDLKNPKYPDVNITFRMLLAHRASLNDTMRALFNIFQYSDNSTQFIYDHLNPDGKYYKEDFWSDHPPGEKGWYSSFGFIILSALVERASGKKFEDYCQKNIFQPLNMYNSSFDIEKLDKNNFARPYFPFFLGFIPFFHYDAKEIAPCGALRTTVLDLSHFLIAHMNNGIWNNVRILQNSTVQEMHKIHYNDQTGFPFYNGTMRFGLGWGHLEINGHHWEGYNGGAVGYSCDMAVNSSENVGVIMLSNVHVYRFTSKFFSVYKFHDPFAMMLLSKAKE